MSPKAKKRAPDAALIVKRLRAAYPQASTALTHTNPLQLLIATILSAQCTDERVNIVTRELFLKYRSAKDYAEADPKVFEREIYSTGFFRAKAKNVIACCRALLERHGGKVPRTMEELTALPGVGRKTANVVLGNAFGIAAGIVVDTHVKRLAERLGLTKETDPVKVEDDLIKIFPQKEWILLPHLLIFHGRQVCDARKPLCPECTLADLCPSAGKFPA